MHSSPQNSPIKPSPILPVEPNIEILFIELFKAIQNHNEQFSVGKAASNRAQNTLNETPEAESLPVTEGSKTSVDTIKAEHAAILKLTGLSLSDTNEVLSGQHTERGKDTLDTRISLHIEEIKVFQEFLRSLNLETLREEEFKKHLATVPTLLATVVREAADINDPGDKTLDLLVSLRSVVKEYERLGLQDACLELALYAQKVSEKILPEFLAVTKQGLLLEPGKGFGPGDWQIDALPSALEKRWDDAFKTVETLGKKEAAAGLRRQVERNLELALESARDQLSKVAPSILKQTKEILRSAHQKVIQATVDTNIVRAADASDLRRSLAELQRHGPPHLMILPDLLFNDLNKEDSIGIAVSRTRDGKLLAYACARTTHLPEEYEIVSFAIEPAYSSIGMEEQALIALGEQLRRLGSTAMRIALSQSDPTLKIIQQLFGEKISEVDSHGGNQIVFRIDLTNSAA